MIITQLTGGLGNQLFQYSLGLNLSIINNMPLKVDISRYQLVTEFRKYSLDEIISNIEIASQSEIDLFKKKSIFGLLKQKKIVAEKEFRFDEGILRQKGNLYLDGFWQSEKYFSSIKNILLDKVNLKNIISPDDFFKYEIEIGNKNSVCLFVRRAELVTNPVFSSYHGYCSEDYYLKAIEIMKQKVDDAFFFIFSDDLEWCYENFNDINNSVIVKHFSKDDKYIQYFILMSFCKHFIIPNSTYGWWAAWLSKCSEKKIIAPKNWFNKANHSIIDLFPSDWIII